MRLTSVGVVDGVLSVSLMVRDGRASLTCASRLYNIPLPVFLTPPIRSLSMLSVAFGAARLGTVRMVRLIFLRSYFFFINSYESELFEPT
jgi:hypothetical protein